MKKVISIILCMVFMLISCANPIEKMSSTELLNLGEKYLLELDYEKAVVYFEKLITIDPMNPRGYTALAKAQVGLGDTSSAIDTLKQGMNTFNDYDEQKIEFLNKLTEIDWTNPDWYLHLAQVYISSEEIELAIDVLNRGIATLDMSETDKLRLKELFDELSYNNDESKVDLWPSFSQNEKNDINTFFSNFADVGFDTFDRNNYDVNMLIYFALLHEHKNNDFSDFSEAENYTKISGDYVEQQIKRYFNITGINGSNYSDPFNSISPSYYENGSYYLMEKTGEPIYYAKVTKFLDNGNGTYTAYYECYLDFSFFLTPDEYRYSCKAIVQPYDDNGIPSYQLVHLESISI